MAGDVPRVTLPALQAMKREARKIAGVVAWDTPMAQLGYLMALAFSPANILATVLLLIVLLHRLIELAVSLPF